MLPQSFALRPPEAPPDFRVTPPRVLFHARVWKKLLAQNLGPFGPYHFILVSQDKTKLI